MLELEASSPLAVVGCWLTRDSCFSRFDPTALSGSLKGPDLWGSSILLKQAEIVLEDRVKMETQCEAKKLLSKRAEWQSFGKLRKQDGHAEKLSATNMRYKMVSAHGKKNRRVTVSAVRQKKKRRP